MDFEYRFLLSWQCEFVVPGRKNGVVFMGANRSGLIGVNDTVFIYERVRDSRKKIEKRTNITFP